MRACRFSATRQTPPALELKLHERLAQVVARERHARERMREGPLARLLLREPRGIRARGREARVERGDGRRGEDVAFAEGDELEVGDGEVGRGRGEGEEVDGRGRGAEDDLLEAEVVKGDERGVCMMECQHNGRGPRQIDERTGAGHDDRPARLLSERDEACAQCRGFRQ